MYFPSCFSSDVIELKIAYLQDLDIDWVRWLKDNIHFVREHSYIHSHNSTLMFFMNCYNNTYFWQMQNNENQSLLFESQVFLICNLSWRYHLFNSKEKCKESSYTTANHDQIPQQRIFTTKPISITHYQSFRTTISLYGKVCHDTECEGWTSAIWIELIIFQNDKSANWYLGATFCTYAGIGSWMYPYSFRKWGRAAVRIQTIKCSLSTPSSGETTMGYVSYRYWVALSWG